MDGDNSGLAASVSALQDEVVWLLVRWNVWRSMFAKNEARIELLNRSARPFFYLVQKSLAADVKVALARLTDHARTGTKDNLTLARLGQLLRLVETAQVAQFDASLADLSALCEPLRDERNRRLAHLDLSLALQLSPEPGGMRVQDIADALGLVVECMSIAEAAADLPQRAYLARASTTDTDGLFRALAKAEEYDRLRSAGIIPLAPRLEVP